MQLLTTCVEIEVIITGIKVSPYPGSKCGGNTRDKIQCVIRCMARVCIYLCNKKRETYFVWKYSDRVKGNGMTCFAE